MCVLLFNAKKIVFIWYAIGSSIIFTFDIYINIYDAVESLNFLRIANYNNLEISRTTNGDNRNYLIISYLLFRLFGKPI